MLAGVVFPVFGGGFPAEFPEDPVKLGEADKAALHGNIRDLVPGIGEEELTVAHPHQMDVVSDRVAGDPLELVGQIVGTHIGFLRQSFQSQILMVVSVDVIGYGVDPFRDLVVYLLLLIDITVLKLIEAVEKTGEKAVQNKLLGAGEFSGGKGRIGLALEGKAHDLIDQVAENAQLLFRKAVNGDLLMKGSKQLPVSVLKAKAVVRKHKVDNQSPGRLIFRITAFVQHGRREKHKIVTLDGVGYTLQKMNGVGT